MAGLPIDAKGYPVPYFVAWFNGKPDHRVADAAKIPIALKRGLCWMCGQPLGAFKSFAIGPMCSITRTISEPPSHLECLRFAVRACPWMTLPNAQRRDNKPDGVEPPPGNGILRNPGVVCIWTTKQFKRWPQPDGRLLFMFDDPVSTEWYREGRRATRAEVEESIRTGLPILYADAEAQDAAEPDAGSVACLEKCIARETAWLDKQEWPAA